MRVRVDVRPEHERIIGISATVARDTVKDLDGAPIEVTTDRQLQDGGVELARFTPETR